MMDQLIRVGILFFKFEYLKNGYGKSKTAVLFNGEAVKKVHAQSFQVLNDGYAKDQNNTYYNGEIFEGKYEEKKESEKVNTKESEKVNTKKSSKKFEDFTVEEISNWLKKSQNWWRYN